MGALLPQAPPNPLPLPTTLVDHIVWDLQTLQSLHIMSPLLLLSRIPLFSQTNLNITFL
jgi:hypothetical protein